MDSIYRRMLVLRPDTKGHVANAAQAGAPAERLPDQARQALSQVPFPRLAIIQTIDDDIRCDGTDPAHVPGFGSALRDALRVIVAASPATQVLVVTQPGRPALELEGMAPLIASNPAVRQMYGGTGPCSLDDGSGAVIKAHVAALTAIISAYEAEQARVCAQFPTCRTDGGALATFRRDPSMVAGDHNHLNVKGLARLAAAVWPFARAALTATPTG